VEPLLFIEQDLVEPQFFDARGARIALYTARCPDHDLPNEDAAALIPCGEDGVVCLVADGVGGARSGGKAARVALAAVADSVLGSNGNGDSRAAILNGFETANQQVAGLGTGAATTLIAVEYRAGTVRTYHVGDSEAAVIGQRGKLKLQTLSHTPSGYGLQAGLLTEDEAIAHDERHVVLNLVGSPDMRIEVGPRLELSARDTLLIGTDGLFDNWPLEQIVQRVRAGALAATATRLARDTRERMSGADPKATVKPDDLTFVLVRRATAS